jgi:DNA (cytosine-5)-methyltransferase 1
MSRRPKAIDLFAGAGGMSLGFEQAGFDIAAAVEVDPIHAATHHFNFPETCIMARSVLGLSGREIRAAAGLSSSDVSVVFGGPPCQGFSLIGQRMLDDPRNQLVREFLRIVVELNATYFVFENVKGLTVGKHRNFLNLLVDEFSQHGYDICLPWRVLNAKNYAIPQDRERLFLLGARRGFAIPAYPQPATGDIGDLFESLALKPMPTCRDALADIPNNEDFDELMSVDGVHVESWIPEADYAKNLHCDSPEAWHCGYRRKWNPKLLTSSLRTAHTDISRRRFAETKQGEIEPISRFFKLPADGQSNTLRAGTDASRGAFTSPRPIHYKYARCVSVREMARLHGYPDWFRFHITKWHGARQIGNSVPPPLARAVAEEVLKAMGIAPKKQQRALSLGKTELLAMDMTEAAEFWNVDVPISRRNCKNGTRKRKQGEIERERQSIRRL